MAPRAIQELRGLGLDAGAKRWIGDRVVHVGEHEIVPDKNSQLVAEREKILALVDHRAADADHVHVRIARLLQPRTHRRPIAGQRHEIRRAPAGTTREDRLTVHDQRKTLAVDASIDRERSETDLPEIDLDAIDFDTDPVKRRRVVRMRPPLLYARQAKTSPEASVRCGRQGDALAGDRHLGCRLRLQRHGQHAVVAVERRVQIDVTHLFDNLDCSPRTDCMRSRGPARHVPQQSRAHEAQCIVLDQPSAPARSALLHGERLIERAKGNEQFVVARQHDIDVVRQEHAVRGEDFGAIQPDLGNGGQTGEPQRALSRAGEPRAIPDILVVQRLRPIETPFPRSLQRLRRRTGHNCIEPFQVGRKFIGSGRHSRRRQRQLPILDQANRFASVDRISS